MTKMKMNSLEKKIQDGLKEAMLEKNTTKVDALRQIKAGIQNEKVNGSYHELTDADILKIIQKLSKQHQESILAYTEGNRLDLAEKEADEKVYLDEFLPKMLTDNELTEIIDSIINDFGDSEKNMKTMGLIMKKLSENYSGQYDGKVVSEIIRKKIS